MEADPSNAGFCVRDVLRYDPIVEMDQRISRLERHIAGMPKDNSGRRSGGGNAD